MDENVREGQEEVNDTNGRMRGLSEMIFSFIGLLFWISITFLLPDIFAKNWRWQGLGIVILAVLFDIIRGAIKIIIWTTKNVHLVEAARNMVSGIANFLLFQIYPFQVTQYLDQRNFDIRINDVDVYIRYFLLFLSTLFFITTVSETYKYLIWDQNKQ